MSLNLSAGLGNAASALQQGANIHAQSDLEAMKDQRAENLARMQFGWKAQHDVNLQQKSFDHDARMSAAADERQGKQISASEAAARASQDAYFDRMQLAGKLADDRQVTSQEGMERRENKRLIAENRIRAAEAETTHMGIISGLEKEIRLAVKDNPQLDLLPIDQRASAMAKDPIIGPMMDRLVDAQNARRKAQAAFVLNGVQLGDQGFQGISSNQVRGATPSPVLSPASPPGPIGNGAPAPTSSSGPTRYSTNDVSNPFENSSNTTAPDYPTDNAADNAPAVDRMSGSGSAGMIPPLAAGATTGMPPTVGPARAPITSLQGPLIQPNQLIPTNQFGSFGQDVPNLAGN